MFHSKTKSYSLARTKSLPPESFLMGITGKKTSPRLEGYTWDKHGNGDYLDVTPRLFGTIPRSNTLSSKPKVTPKVRLLASAPSSPRSERRHPPEQSSPTVTPPSSRVSLGFLHLKPVVQNLFTFMSHNQLLTVLQ